MLTYVSDAVAFLYYLLDEAPPDTTNLFKDAEKGNTLIYLPTIAAAELYYLFEKKGWMNQWTKLMKEMKRHATFNYYPFNEDILNLFKETRAREIHDKIIISTTKILKAEALITKDEELCRLHEVNTVW